jgi:hypothetical protein
MANLDLKTEVLDSAIRAIDFPVDLRACLNSHGLYNSEQFVLRLSPVIHRKLADAEPGIRTGAVDTDLVQAFSTYLHETIHWWQHSGSVLGLILSLSYPAQAHANYTHLKRLITKIGPRKSVLRFVETNPEPGGNLDTPAGVANTIVNNHFDIEFFRILTFDPLKAREVGNHQMFHSMGHSYEMTYHNIIHVLAMTFDREVKVLPDPRGWDDAFRELKKARVLGYYPGSKIELTPIGARQIFEGQARFGQLLYLYFASGGALTWETARQKGMLKGIYVEAFEQFLRLAGIVWPESIGDPEVALFLLVCDVAINPGDGFPMPLKVFETFIADVDPGFRFCFLCRLIATMPGLAKAITQYSREEYVQISSALCSAMLVHSPMAITSEFVRWAENNDTLRLLLDEHRMFDYGPENLPVRLLFAHFLAFQSEKLAKPEFFCWPGAWMAGQRVSTDIADLFDRLSAPFVDREDDGGIYPRLMADKSEGTVRTTFNSFYAMTVKGSVVASAAPASPNCSAYSSAFSPYGFAERAIRNKSPRRRSSNRLLSEGFSASSAARTTAAARRVASGSGASEPWLARRKRASSPI